MKKFPIGIQLYSVRDDIDADYPGTLKKLKEMGYDGVEFADIPEQYSSADLKKMCEDAGLVPISAHIGYRDFLGKDDETYERMIKYFADIGCKQLVIPSISRAYRPGTDGFPETIEMFKKVSGLCKKYGMIFAYHNHDFDFVDVDGEYALDLLYRVLDADTLQTQIDTCWVSVCEIDPAEYIRKYTGRAPTVHLKDYIGERTDNMYKLIGVDAGKQQKVDESSKFALRPVGYGKQDFKSILEAAEDAGAEWVIVEQDDPSLDNTPMECAKMSVDFIKSIMK